MELKFRAYDPAKEEFIYSDQVAGGMWRFFKTLEDRGMRHFEAELYADRSDDFGRDIYAGDIIQWEFGDGSGRISQVIFNKGYFGIGEDYMTSLAAMSKIIILGNISQNPELLEVKR